MCNEEITIRIEEVKPVEIGVKLDIAYAEDPTLVSRLDELNGEVVGVTSSAKIATAIDSKEAIAEAVTAKGVEISEDVPLAEYAAKIREIKAATPKVEGTPGNGFPVRFFDYDGTLLKTHYVHKGEDATPPELPEHEYLSFQQWNNGYTNIQEPTDTGALYDTSDGASYFFVKFLLGDSLTIWLRHTVTGGTSTVEWGDGTSDVNESTEEFVTSHTYETPGDYIIRLSGSDGAAITFSRNYMCDPSGNTSTSLVRKIFFSSKMNTYKVFPASSIPYLSEITLPPGDRQYMYTYLSRLKALILPPSMNDYQVTFRQCRELKHLVFPNIAINVTSECFDGLYLKTLVYPAKAVSLSGAYVGYIEKIVMRGTKPPIFSANAKIRFGKIYVPEGTLETYKNATNWSTYADIMEEYTEETILW